MSPRVFLILSSLSTVAFAAPPPFLHIPLSVQLIPANPALSSVYPVHPSSALLVDAPNTSPALRVPPEWSFSIGLQWDTFVPAPEDTVGILSYSAALADGDALPAWIFFNRQTYVFAGLAPKTPQNLRIVVTASSSSGESASDTFTLIVSSYDLYVTAPLLIRNVTAGQHFSIALNDFQGVHLSAGAEAYSVQNYKQILIVKLAIDVSSLSWLSYEPNTRVLQGTPPFAANAEESILGATVTLLRAQQSLSVWTTLTLVVVPPAFSSLFLPTLRARPNETVYFTLLPYITSLTTWTVYSAAYSTDETWIFFDPVRLWLTGRVPVSAPDTVRITFMASDSQHGMQSTAYLELVIVHDATPAPSPYQMSAPHGSRKGMWIVGVVMGAIILIFIALALIKYRCHRVLCSSKPCQKPQPTLTQPLTLIHHLKALLLPHIPSSQRTLQFPKKKAMSQTSAFRHIFTLPAFLRKASHATLAQRPPIRKGRIGYPISSRQRNVDLLSISNVLPIRAGDMKTIPSRQTRERSCQSFITPISTLSHIAIKGTLEDMECGLLDEVSEETETLAQRKTRLLGHRRKQTVTNIVLSPSGQATVTVAAVGPTCMNKSLPPTPVPLDRPAAPTPAKARPAIPVLSASASIDSSAESKGSRPQRELDHTSRPMPIPRSTFMRCKTSRTTAVPRYNANNLRSAESVMPSLLNLSSSPGPFFEPATPPPSIPLPPPPNVWRPLPQFGESDESSESMFAGRLDETEVTARFSGNILSMRASVCTPSHPGGRQQMKPSVVLEDDEEHEYPYVAQPYMTARASVIATELKGQLELTMDQFGTREFSTSVLSQVGLEQETHVLPVGWELRGVSPASDGSTEAEQHDGIKRGAGRLVTSMILPVTTRNTITTVNDLRTSTNMTFSSSILGSVRVFTVSYLPNTPFLFKLPLDNHPESCPDSNVNNVADLVLLCAHATLDTRLNGDRPPPWIAFDASRKTFRGITPSLNSGRKLKVRLNVWDRSINAVVGGCEIRVEPEGRHKQQYEADVTECVAVGQAR